MNFKSTEYCTFLFVVNHQVTSKKMTIFFYLHIDCVRWVCVVCIHVYKFPKHFYDIDRCRRSCQGPISLNDKHILYLIENHSGHPSIHLRSHLVFIKWCHFYRKLVIHWLKNFIPSNQLMPISMRKNVYTPCLSHTPTHSIFH